MTSDDKPPPVWIGHVILKTRKWKESEAFMRALGIRFLTREGEAAILELRGGTLLILLDDKDAEAASDSAPAMAGDAGFDLMVDDLDAAHGVCKDQGLEPSGIDKGRNHRSFTVTEPSGHKIKFFDSHVSEFPV